MIFEITNKEMEDIDEWKKKHDRICPVRCSTLGGKYSYIFCPTGIGTFVSVRCICQDEYHVNRNL